MAPLGNDFIIEDGKEYLMAAGGTGIAPVAFAAQEMQKRGIKYSILYGGRSAGDVHLDELEEFGLKAQAVTEDGTAGLKGLVTKPLEERLKGAAANIEVFACGPWAMMKAASEVAEKAGKEHCWCSLERYMACGFGVCLACVYKKNSDEKFHTCCKEGPIVNGLEVNWDA
jgi:dihydroorotate dehydrogenase electron transfer subunit